MEKSSVTQLNSGGDDYGSGKTCAFGGLIELVANNMNGEKIIISQSSAHGEIYTKKNAGGLIGFIEPEASIDILNSYAQVKISNRCNGNDDCLAKYAGGLIGRAKEDGSGSLGTINLEYVYAAGEIQVLEYDGGKGVIGGDNDAYSNRVIAHESYFDTEASTQKKSGDNAASAKLTTKEMHAPATFANWNTDIWKISKDAYPQIIH